MNFSDNSNEQILARINDQIKERMIMFKPYSNELHNYSLAITGTVGSGKSTMCESLCALFNSVDIDTNTYPEFLSVNSDISGAMLSKKISGEIKSNTFQAFVIDSWSKLLKMKPTTGNFNIFERCPDDAVLCFCNIENMNGSINDLEMYSMYLRLRELLHTYDVPTYTEANLNFTEVMSGELNICINEILDVIFNDITNGIHKRIIGLRVSDYTSKARICMRARDGESGYTDKDIALYNEHYSKLFQMLNDGKYIARFLDLGRLL